MLKGPRTKQEVDVELARLYKIYPHVWLGDDDEAQEARSQLQLQAEQNVAQRQAEDLLEMLHEWRCEKTGRMYFPLLREDL